jgi:hypothetical protein
MRPRELQMKNEHWEITDKVSCVVLTQGMYALVNTSDLPKLAGYRWFAIRNRQTFYASAHVPGNHAKKLKMHQLLLRATSSMEIDHRNGNGLDNSSLFGPLNIRVVTSRQNSQNRHTGRSSPFVGVYRLKDCNRFRVVICIDGKYKHLATVKNARDGAKIYKKACSQLEAG